MNDGALRRLFPHHERRIPWKLVRSWFIQSIGWYALAEVAGRVVLETGFVLLLLSTGVGFLETAAAWLAFHTVAWILLYGGFMRFWIVFGLGTRVEHLREQVDRCQRRAVRQSLFRLVFLRGSGARGELNERSDVDVCFVPRTGMSSKILGVLYLWGVRAESVLRRFPLEARWIDVERYVPYHVIEETPLILFREAATPGARDRLSRRGLLVTFSGIDGSGKTTIVKRLEADLRANGIGVTRFWGHRQAWYKARAGPDLGLAVLFESLWRRLGRQVPEFRDHRWVKGFHDLLNLVDYVYVRWRLADRLRPNTIVLCDRYVADVVAYLRTLGPLKVTIEGLLVGLAREPDLAFLFHIEPREALNRKQENTFEELQRFTQEYRSLTDFLGLAVIDASRPIEEVYSQIWAILIGRLGVVSGEGFRAAQSTPTIPVSRVT